MIAPSSIVLQHHHCKAAPSQILNLFIRSAIAPSSSHCQVTSSRHHRRTSASSSWPCCIIAPLAIIIALPRYGRFIVPYQPRPNGAIVVLSRILWKTGIAWLYFLFLNLTWFQFYFRRLIQGVVWIIKTPRLGVQGR